jgi:hypothetical protein
VQTATITLVPAVLGSEYKLRLADHILPGRVVNGGCFAPSAEFERNRAAFDTVLASLRPR